MTSANRRAIEDALKIYRRSEGLDVWQKDDAVRLLGSHGIWSLSHIAAITGVTRQFVRRRVEKTDHSGGRFNPDTLELILEELELEDAGKTNPFLTDAIADMGTSIGFLGRVLGRSRSSMIWRHQKGERP